MPTVDGPVLIARLRDEYRYLLRPDSTDGLIVFLRNTPIFRVQKITRPAWLTESYKILDMDVGTLNKDYLDFIKSGMYVLTVGDTTSYLPMEDMLRAISDLPEGTKWSFLDPQTSEMTLSPA